MIVLAYLWPLALVPLLLEKQDPEVQWHAKHGLVLMIAELLVFFAYIAVTSLVSLATLVLGVLTLILGIIVSFHPSGSLNVVAVLFGILMILSGIFHLVRIFDEDERHRVP